MRLVADRDPGAHRAFEPLLRVALLMGRHRNVDLVQHRLCLGARFPERLAGLAGDQVGERLELAAHDIGEAARTPVVKGRDAQPAEAARAAATAASTSPVSPVHSGSPVAGIRRCQHGHGG